MKCAHFLKCSLTHELSVWEGEPWVTVNFRICYKLIKFPCGDLITCSQIIKCRSHNEEKMARAEARKIHPIILFFLLAFRPK